MDVIRTQTRQHAYGAELPLTTYGFVALAQHMLKAGANSIEIKHHPALYKAQEAVGRAAQELASVVSADRRQAIDDRARTETVVLPGARGPIERAFLLNSGAIVCSDQLCLTGAIGGTHGRRVLRELTACAAQMRCILGPRQAVLIARFTETGSDYNALRVIVQPLIQRRKDNDEREA